MTNTGENWNKIASPFSEFELEEEGEDGQGTATTSFNLCALREVRFRVSAYEDGWGRFTIDELQSTQEPDVEKVRSSSLISQFRVQDNPISPNQDGQQDDGIFLYKLLRDADVYLRIYDTTGHLLWEKRRGNQCKDSEHCIMWNGNDKKGNRVRNGIYIYKFEAKDDEGNTDSIKNVIGVFR